MIGNIFSRLDALQSLQSSAETASHPGSGSVTPRTDPSTQASVSVLQAPDSALSPTDSVRTKKRTRKIITIAVKSHMHGCGMSKVISILYDTSTTR